MFLICQFPFTYEHNFHFRIDFEKFSVNTEPQEQLETSSFSSKEANKLLYYMHHLVKWDRHSSVRC